MSITLKEFKRSQSGKRVDAIIRHKAMFKKARLLKVRILAYDPLPEEEYELESIFEKVMEAEGEWKACKKSCSYRLNKENATAYILDKDYQPKKATDDGQGTQEVVQ
jgi:hypothetical protein